MTDPSLPPLPPQLVRDLLAEDDPGARIMFNTTTGYRISHGENLPGDLIELLDTDALVDALMSAQGVEDEAGLVPPTDAWVAEMAEGMVSDAVERLTERPG